MKQNGQALIENVLLIPIIVITVVMIAWFSRVVLTKQQLLMGAKYGTDLIYFSKMDDQSILEEVKDYMCGRDVKGRRLNPDNMKFSIWKETLPKIDSINSMDDLEVIRNNFLNPADHTSYVEITYEFATPPIFSVWDKFIPGAKLPEAITVSARSEVLAGTGVEE